MGIFDFAKDTLGIDPGSSNLRIIKDDELLFNEPSCISIDKMKNVVTGFGKSVRVIANDVVVRPVDCVIADFQGFEILLRQALNSRKKSTSILPKSYRMIFCIPTSTTEIEKRAYRDSAEHTGATDVHMIYQSCCAAIGLNILLEKRNFVLVDFGYSKIELTVFANSFPLSVGIVRMGSSKICRLIKNCLQRRYGLNVTIEEIESILITLKAFTTEIHVRNVAVSVDEINAVLESLFFLVNDEFAEALERVKGSDLDRALAGGIYFTGGGSAIDFLRDKIIPNDRVKRMVSQNPFMDNITGLKEVIAERDRFKAYMMT